MNKHISDKLMYDYAEGILPESECKLVESHLEICEECREIVEEFIDTLADPGFYEAEASQVSDDKVVSYIVQQIDSFLNQPSIFKQWFLIFFNFIRSVTEKQTFQPEYAEIPKCRSGATTRDCNEKTLFSFSSWFPNKAKIIRVFDNIQITITFHSVPGYTIFKKSHSNTFFITVKLVVPCEHDVRVTLSAGNFYEVSELIRIKEPCQFDNVSLAPHRMTFEYQSEKKGEILFSVLERGILMQPKKNQETTEHENVQQSVCT